MDVEPFDPAAYPGPRPDGPVLVHRGRVWPLALDDATSWRPVAGHTAPGAGAGGRARGADAGPGATGGSPPGPDAVPALAELEAVRFSVAYGSNASPGRLVSKGLDRDGALLLPARVAGFAAAFEGRRTGYGAVPVTLVPADGVLHTWVLGLPAPMTRVLDRSEGRTAAAATAPPGVAEDLPDDEHTAPPGAYRLAGVGEVAVADRFRLPRGLAYRPGPATHVQVDAAGRPRTWPAVSQAEARSHVDEGGPLAPVPPAGDAVVGEWPTTALEDLPLFVYGSLRPGGSAWSAIAADVEVVGDAAATGVLYDTGRGWPAAELGGQGTVHGTLLVLRPGTAATTLARVDAYEAVPTLFRRATVQVATPTGPRFALGYTWADRGPPAGRRLPEGHWPPP